MIGKSLAAIAAGLILCASPAAAVTIDFTGGGSATDGTDGNIRPFSSGGISVQASAWTGSLNAPTASYLGWYSHGLGVTNASEGNGSTGNSHTVDNYAGTDFIVLVFNQAVNISAATLYPFDVDPSTTNPLDNDALVSNASLLGAFTTPATPIGTASAVWASLYANRYNVSGNTSSAAPNPYLTSLTSAGRYGNVWVIGAANSNPDRTYDGFKLSSIVVTAAVPEPGTWAMLLLGFGMMGMALRWRRSPAPVRAKA